MFDAFSESDQQPVSRMPTVNNNSLIERDFFNVIPGKIRHYEVSASSGQLKNITNTIDLINWWLFP